MRRVIEAGRVGRAGAPGRSAEQRMRTGSWTGPVGRAGTRRFRTLLVERIRREIAEGRYETEARIDGAVAGVLARVRPA